MSKSTMRFEDDNIIIHLSEEGMIFSRKRDQDDVDTPNLLVLNPEESISFTQQFNMGQMAIQQASPMQGLIGFMNRILGGEDNG